MSFAETSKGENMIVYKIHRLPKPSPLHSTELPATPERQEFTLKVVT